MNYLLMTFFLIFSLIILFGAHYLVFFSTVNFFSIENHSARMLLAALLLIFGTSYFINSIIAHWKDNLLTQGFYFLSGFWLGALTNLVITIIMAWSIVVLFNIFKINYNLFVIGFTSYVIALLVSIWGVYNALHPVIKNISVNIPGLPDVWKGKTVVQISDVHLGHIYRSGFMSSIVDKVNTENPQAVFITGDLFDGMDGNIAPLIQPIDKLSAPKGIFYINGNHETYLGLDKAYDAIGSTKITPLRDEVRDIDGLKIIGISYPERRENKDILTTIESLKKDFIGYPNILLYHSPVNIDQIKNSGINLELTGHTHCGQIIPFNLITGLVYKGYDYGLFPMGDYTLYASCGTGTWGPTMRTVNRPEIVSIKLN